MHKEEGIKLLHELAAKSDVFVENFIPGKAKELGFDYDTLARINPRLMYGACI